MKTHNSFRYSEVIRPQSSMTTVAAWFAGILLVAVSLTGSAVAQSNDNRGMPERICILLGMLGASPPHCDEDADSDDISPEVQAQLDALQLSVMPFFNYDVAVAAGWDTIPGGECVESPMGGMGYHVQNIDQLTNGYLNLLRPEALLYAPMEDGSMEFQGVEYIIPAELWTSEDPPVFLERDLHFNPNVGPFGIWALHVWVGKQNPNGIFADWNPEVSCQFAAEAA